MRCSILLVSLAALLSNAVDTAAKSPVLLRTPNGGVQPQALFDGKGVLHLIYFKGKDAEGDIFYVRRLPGKNAFSAPIRVNSQAGSAVAAGTIRGGQLAIGKDQRVHVVWNGSMKALPKSPNNGHPMLYSRLGDSGTFEEQRNLMQQTFVLDGGGTVAADRAGNVYVSWHAIQVGTANGEENRHVWVAVSHDDGKTFAKETLASDTSTGACGCCGMRGLADSKGGLHLLYRSASEKTNRDIFLLSSNDQGKTFQSTLVQKWSINSCPMSSEAFAEGPGGVAAAWDSEGQVSFARLEAGMGKLSRPVSAPGAGKNRKHPAVAIGPKGETILVWTEGTGWQRGGALVWQVFDAAGKPTSDKGRIDGGVPVWGLPTVVADPEGGYVIVH